ncbi:MAG: thermosome subunit [Methanomicrobiales archaeon]|nr:thermosome subunit [Methanomicrobiales archaeon]
MQLTGQPIIILKEGVERTRGHEAQRSNIAAAKAIAAAVRTTLGPRGMDKMIIDSTGDIVITNDGATILHELSIQHPGGKMVVEVAETQDDEVGDGTTTACIIVGALMEAAERMLEQEIHPTVIAQGYRMGMEKAIEIVKGLSITVKPDDVTTLKKIADTAMTGKSIEQVKEKLDGIVVDAVRAVVQTVDGKLVVDEDDVKIMKHVGETMDDAEFIRGIVIEKKRVSEEMPKKIEKAKIALVATPLEITKTQVKSKIRITSPDQLGAFDVQEKDTLRQMADLVVKTGANVVLCQKGIADSVQYYLAKNGIMAIEDVPEKDMLFAARALNTQIANKPHDLTAKMLGQAELVEEMEGVDLVRISGCRNPRAVTILVRGSTQVLIDEMERAVYDGVRVVMDAIEDQKYVVGGGSVETEVMLRVKEYAASVGGRVQLAIEAFADAFESIPRTLAENSGFNPIDKLVELKAAHAKGKKRAGLNVYTGKIVDMYEENVFEPMRVKVQAIQSGAEAASLLIRVDDMMITQRGEPPMMPPGGMPPMHTPPMG